MASLLEMKGITKIYDNGTLANDGVDISLEEREIHAVAGENGAGKSTVMKVLYGLEQCDSGRILLRGKPVKIQSPRDAMALGIGMVQQHFTLVGELRVYENIFLGQEIRRRGVLDRCAMIERTNNLGIRYGMSVDPEARCRDLTVGMAQRVEILKVLARDAKILILDEPTAVLTPQETQELFEQLRLLRDGGCACVLITHKLKEIKALCDRVTVLRAGRTVGGWPVADMTEDEISRRMVGRDVQLTLDKTPMNLGDTALEVSELNVSAPSGKAVVRDISFRMYAGEILCLAGVEGNGQREAVECITGARKSYTGQILLRGADIRPMSIRRIRAAGQRHIPGDRMASGVNRDASILDNLISVSYRDYARMGLLRYKALGAKAGEQMRRYQVKAESISQRISLLSGGNIQKVVAAREMDGNPVVLIADQPTRGVDVGTMELIHRRLLEMRDAGCAILLVSSDLGEVFNLSDRILVFHEGEIAAEITDIEHLTEDQLGRYMLGLDRMEGGRSNA